MGYEPKYLVTYKGKRKDKVIKGDYFSKKLGKNNESQVIEDNNILNSLYIAESFLPQTEDCEITRVG